MPELNGQDSMEPKENVSEEIPLSGGPDLDAKKMMKSSSNVVDSAPMMYFTGHHAYIVNIAKNCRESELYTDVKIHCQDGELSAHRLVLASCSAFLRDIFLGLPQGLPEFTFMIPNIKKQVVEKLIDFLYTGQMNLERSNTYDLQQLVHILKIDPENVRIETPDESKQVRLKQSKLRFKPSVTKELPSGNTSPRSGSESSTPRRRNSSSSRPDSPAVFVNKVVETKAMPLRKRKRSSVDEGSDKETKVPNVIPELSSSTTLSTFPTTTSTTSSPLRGGLALRRRGRPRQSGANMGNRNHSSQQPMTPSLLSSGDKQHNTGFHDLTNTHTWVCGICHQYDPVLPNNLDSQDAPANTEWVGCDCDRWFHQYCTKLKTVDDGFSCKQVKLKCLKKLDD